MRAIIIRDWFIKSYALKETKQANTNYVKLNSMLEEI